MWFTFNNCFHTNIHINHSTELFFEYSQQQLLPNTSITIVHVIVLVVIEMAGWRMSPRCSGRIFRTRHVNGGGRGLGEFLSWVKKRVDCLLLLVTVAVVISVSFVCRHWGADHFGGRLSVPAGFSLLAVKYKEDEDEHSTGGWGNANDECKVGVALRRALWQGGVIVLLVHVRVAVWVVVARESGILELGV